LPSIYNARKVKHTEKALQSAFSIELFFPLFLTGTTLYRTGLLKLALSRYEKYDEK